MNTIAGSAFLSAQTVKVHTIEDSTMEDYTENTTHTRRWGEKLRELFSNEVRVINYAHGGRSSRSFCEEGLWDKVKKNISSGDYVFIQFAHNDEKEGGKYIDETRGLGGTPVLITPIVRCYFDETGKMEFEIADWQVPGLR